MSLLCPKSLGSFRWTLTPQVTVGLWNLSISIVVAFLLVFSLSFVYCLVKKFNAFLIVFEFVDVPYVRLSFLELVCLSKNLQNQIIKFQKICIT